MRILHACLDCSKLIDIRSTRCHKCHNRGSNNPNFKHGHESKDITLHKKCVCGEFIEKESSICKSCYIDKHNKDMIGVNHPNWKGGVSFEEYGQEFDSYLKEQIRCRDKYECRICSCSQLENGRALDVHHIDYNKQNNNISNLISLCKSCHTKTNYKRTEWQVKFAHREL